MDCICIVNLPIELVYRAFTYLEARDLFHCKLVRINVIKFSQILYLRLITSHNRKACKVLHEIVESSVELQLTLELGKHCMVPDIGLVRADEPLASSLERFKQREHAWKHSQWNRRATITCPELVDGSFPGTSNYFDGVYSYGNRHRLSFIDLKNHT